MRCCTKVFSILAPEFSVAFRPITTKKHTAPMRITILPVRVNGSGPLNFVLDSGAGATVIIDSRATRNLQLEMQGEVTVSGVGTGDDPVRSAGVGGARGRSHEA